MGNVNCLRCRFRHPDNGNCTATGGFCTAVPAAHCPLLQQYLGTGLTPEQVENAKAIIESAFAEDTSRAERIRKLLVADDEGRVIILPCKVGDTVYQLRQKTHARGMGISPRIVSSACVWADGSYALTHQGMSYCQNRDFGKTWFLTSAEAEKALQQMEGESET